MTRTSNVSDGNGGMARVESPTVDTAPIYGSFTLYMSAVESERVARGVSAADMATYFDRSGCRIYFDAKIPPVVCVNEALDIKSRLAEFDAKPVQAKPVQAKPVQAKPVQAKPVQAKPVQAKPVQAKPVQAKPVQTGKVRVCYGKELLTVTRASDQSVWQLRQDGHEFLIYRGTRLVVRHRTVREALRTLAGKGCTLSVTDIARFVRSDSHDAAFSPKIGGNGKGVAQVGHMMPLKRMSRLNEREVMHTGQIEKGSYTVEAGKVRRIIPLDNGRKGNDDTPYSAEFDAGKRESVVKGAMTDTGLKPKIHVDPETFEETHGYDAVPLRYWHSEVESVRTRDDSKRCKVVNGLHTECLCS